MPIVVLPILKFLLVIRQITKDATDCRAFAVISILISSVTENSNCFVIAKNREAACAVQINNETTNSISTYPLENFYLFLLIVCPGKFKYLILYV